MARFGTVDDILRKDLLLEGCQAKDLMVDRRKVIMTGKNEARFEGI